MRLTPNGRGAVATLLYVGDVAMLDSPGLFRAANGKPMAAQLLGRVLFGRWGEETAEEVVVCRIAEGRTEIHCHGGAAAIARLSDSLRLHGVAELSPFAQRKDAFSRSERRLAAGLHALSNAPTFHTAIWLHEQAVLRQKRSESSEEPPSELKWLEFARHLTIPWKVVLCGPPNAGKSRLMNALLGESRSIVFDQPGTTRDALTAITACDGWPVEFVDTAGLRETSDSLEAAGIAKTREHLTQADLALFVVDGSAPIPLDWLDDLQTQISHTVSRLWVLNKSDLGCADQNLQNKPCRVSALTGDGIPELLARISKALIPELPPPGTLLPWGE